MDIGVTPTRRVGKVNAISFRVVRFKDGRVVHCAYNGTGMRQPRIPSLAMKPRRCVSASPSLMTARTEPIVPPSPTTIVRLYPTPA